jgi:hypothetical protein
MKKTIILFFFFLFVSCAYSQEYKYNAGKSETFCIQSLPSDLRIEGYKGSDIIIRTKNYKAPGADPRAAGLKSAFNMDDNTGLGLKIFREGHTITITSSGGKGYLYRQVNYDIKIPDYLNLEVLLKSKEIYRVGKVFVKNISKSFVFENTYGNLVFEDITGPASISVESGNVEGTFAKLSQKSDTYISSLYGIIDITIPDNTPANIFMKNPYGEIFTDFNIDYDKDKSPAKNIENGIIEGKLNGGGIRLDIKTGSSNNIYLRKKSGNTRKYLDYGVSLPFNENMNFDIPKENANQKKLAVINEVKDDEHKTAPFQLTGEQRVRIFAVGERDNDGGLCDYGYIEKADTKETVWKMKLPSTKHAGGADKNRYVDINTTLPAGKYILHYVTDDSHSYDDWNSDAPYFDFWGIMVLSVKGDKKDRLKTKLEKDNNLEEVNEPDEIDEPVIRILDYKESTGVNIPVTPPSVEATAAPDTNPEPPVRIPVPPFINEIRDEFFQYLLDEHLIKKENANDVEISSTGLSINGIEQSQKIFEKAKKEFDSLIGRKLKDKVYIHYEKER